MENSEHLKKIIPDFDWVDGYCASIICPECGKDLLINDMEITTCDCGNKYMFQQNNEVFKII